MAKTKKQAALSVPEPDRREGHKLAITMLRDLEASTELCDLCALDEFVTGRATPQDNIVLRYLEKCRERSASVEAGFCAILSDFVAESSEGFCLKASDYQKGLKIRVPGPRISKEAERRRTWKSIQRVTGAACPDRDVANAPRISPLSAAAQLVPDRTAGAVEQVKR